MEIVPNKGGQIARSAGTSCQLIDKMGRKGYCLVQIASREQRYVREDALGTIGQHFGWLKSAVLLLELFRCVVKSFTQPAEHGYIFSSCFHVL